MGDQAPPPGPDDREQRTHMPQRVYSSRHSLSMRNFSRFKMAWAMGDSMLLAELERRTAMEIKNEEARVRIACELASYKLRNMR